MFTSFQAREAFRYFGRAKRLNLITLAAISLTLMGLGLVIALQFGILRLTAFAERQIEVVAFLNDQISPQDLDAFLTRVRAVPRVAGVTYRSKEDALQEFSEDASLQRFVSALGSNPLPASVRVQLTEKTPATVREFAAWLNEQPGIEETTYGGGDADRLLDLLRLVRLAAALLAAALALAAVIIIGNVLSLMVYTHREEIVILRLVGASTGFIRGPFLIWGTVQGVAGGLVASGLLYGLWALLAAFAARELGLNLNTWLPPRAAEQALVGAGGLVVLGAALGLIGSLLSVGRQLRE